ncbi:MAG: hypothetical protein KDD15_32850 [Lewinella sp.]|nr:hypothetical protein [Lewinella sp.]
MSANRSFLLLLLLILINTGSLPAQNSMEEAAVKACIQQLFESMRAGDSKEARTIFQEDARIQTVTSGPDGKPQISAITPDYLLDYIDAAEVLQLDERIRRYEIKIDGLLATAWTEYTFYRRGKLSHCGTNAFQLFRSEEGWKITQITDTRYTEGCAEIPEDFSNAKMTYQFPIPFAPENYLCYRTESPLRIDGKLDETAWISAPWTNDFVDIEGELKPMPEYRTRVKMLWDEEYFYFAAQLEEPHLWATLHQRDTIIFHDDDFEIFIDPDGDGHHYAEFEMNAHNTVWDMLLHWPYHLRRGPNTIFNWNIPNLKTAVHLEGTLNDPEDTDRYWSVEIAFPWSALRELAPGKAIPKNGDQWRVNFSRVDWHMDIINGRYVKITDPEANKNLPPENWVWSPTGRIDMHRPETWGYVQFSDDNVLEQDDRFQPRQEEAIKWVLWQLFYQQRAFQQQYGWYTADVTHFTLPELPDLPFSPQFYAGPDFFKISAVAPDGLAWHIDHTGKIWKR